MRLRYVSPDGFELFEGLSGRTSGPFIEQGTLTGFVGVFEDTDVQVPGVPGAFVDGRDRVVQPLTGSFAVVVHSLDEWQKVRRGFSTSRVGELVLTHGTREYRLPVRLAEVPQSPGDVPRSGSRVEVQLRGDGGVWLETRSATTASVTLRNDGDVPVSPTVVWSGAGGVVTLPSGARFTLPAVTGEHRLSLAPENSGRVLTPAGKHNPALSDQVGAVGERVPVRASRRFAVPEGARLEWELGRFDPWI